MLGVSHHAVPQGVGGGGVAGLDVRVLAAIDPRHEAAIREDLYHRLSDFVIALPPLRERLEDIPELVTDFMKRYAGHRGTSASMIPTPDAMEYLQQQRWPGNVRELENAIERACILSDSMVLEPKDLGLADVASSTPEILNGLDLSGSLSDVATRALRFVEPRKIAEALIANEGNKARTAEALGVSYKTLLAKMKDYDL